MQLWPTAVYLPAISDAYLAHVPGSAFPRPVPITPNDLNFLDPNCSLFHYPFALTSAGQTNGNISANPNMLRARNPNRTVVLADSGGFQIQGGEIPFHGTATTTKMLKWMEDIGDYSMVLDFPTGGINRGTIDVHHDRLEQSHGQQLNALKAQNRLGDGFNACLLQTIINNNEFVHNRVSGATRLLNVVQGRTEAESKAWYEAVKHFPFEDWSLAGGHQTSFVMVLNRIFDMIQDGKLQDARWLHVLGISKPWSAVLLTTLQNCIREYINPNLQISFDSASPFRGAANNNINVGFTLDRSRWVLHSKPLPQLDKSLYGLTLNQWSKLHLPTQEPENIDKEEELPKAVKDAMIEQFITTNTEPARTAIGNLVTPADILQSSSGGADSTGVALLMNHNVQVYINAFGAANSIMAEHRPGQVPANLPADYLAMAILIQQLFENHRQQPHAYIQGNSRFFDRYANL